MVLNNINQKTDQFQINKNYPSEKIDRKNTIDRSIDRNLVTFSISMTMLSLFKKGSGSLKNLFLYLYFVFNILYLLTLALIYLL